MQPSEEYTEDYDIIKLVIHIEIMMANIPGSPLCVLCQWIQLMLQNNYDIDIIIISDIDKKIGIEKLDCLVELGQLASGSARIQTQASKPESLRSLYS